MPGGRHGTILSGARREGGKRRCSGHLAWRYWTSLTILSPPGFLWPLPTLAGEMRDTAQLGPLSAYLTNALMPREDRTKLFRTWASLLAMLPVGGEKVSISRSMRPAHPAWVVPCLPLLQIVLNVDGTCCF